MTVSRARLVAHADCGRSRVAHAYAAAPQRWAFGAPSGDGWVDVCHQAVGDGVFAGDCCRATIEVGRTARAVVRSITATPLRGPGKSATITRIRVAADGTLLHLPGALIPQRESDHAVVLRVDAAAGARVLLTSAVVLGRTGMGERGAFTRLRTRTSLRYGGALSYADEAALRPSAWLSEGAAGLGAAQAALSVFAIGDWPPSEPGWWDAFTDFPTARRGVSRLRLGGVTFRALCATLGDTQELVAGIERAARAYVSSVSRSLPESSMSSSWKSNQTV